MTSQEQSGEGQEVVIDPVTGEPVTDDTLAQAIREGTHYITRRPPFRTVVDWNKFMAKRRTYRRIPRYDGLSEEDVDLWLKMGNETMVPVRMIGAIWGRVNYKQCLDFIVAKNMPVYRWPSGTTGRAGYYVFSGDILRAIKSCQIDLHADGDAWIKYMVKSERWERKKRLRKIERKREDAAFAGGNRTDRDGEDEQLRTADALRGQE